VKLRVSATARNVRSWAGSYRSFITFLYNC
jgi:hypothetical protein